MTTVNDVTEDAYDTTSVDTVSRIFKEDEPSKGRGTPAWLTQQMFSMAESSEDEDLWSQKTATLTADDLEHDTSDDGLGTEEDYLSGQYVPETTSMLLQMGKQFSSRQILNSGPPPGINRGPSLRNLLPNADSIYTASVLSPVMELPSNIELGSDQMMIGVHPLERFNSKSNILAQMQFHETLVPQAEPGKKDAPKGIQRINSFSSRSQQINSAPFPINERPSSAASSDRESTIPSEPETIDGDLDLPESVESSPYANFAQTTAYEPKDDQAPIPLDMLLLQSIGEMLVHQSLFVKHLRLVERSYMNVARASIALARKPRILSEHEIDAIFLNWRDLLLIATELKRALRSHRLKGDDSTSGIVINMVNALAAHLSYMRVFAIYISEHVYTSRTREVIVKRRQGLQELIELNEHCDQVQLGTMLSRPLGYISEIRGILERLRHGLGEEKPDDDSELRALRSVAAQTLREYQKADESIARELMLSEARSRVVAIQEKLFSGKINLVAAGRYCVRYGPLQKLTTSNKKEGKTYTFFMFDDLIVGAEGKNGQMRVKYVLDLQEMKVTESAGLSFHIESTNKSLLLSGSSEALRNSWINDIKIHSRALASRRGFSNVRNPFEFDEHIRDDMSRIKSTVELSMAESAEFMAARKGGEDARKTPFRAMGSIVSISIASAGPKESGSIFEYEEPTMVSEIDTPDRNTSSGAVPAAHGTLKIQVHRPDTINEEDGSPKASSNETPPKMSRAGSRLQQQKSQVESGANGLYTASTDLSSKGLIGDGMTQGYLKAQGSTFKQLVTMFFVLNAAKKELGAWKLKAEAQRSISQPKKTVLLVETVVFPCDSGEGAGFELYTGESKRGQVYIAPDPATRDNWVAALSTFKSPDRTLEAFFEKRGGSQGTKPWKTRYFVMLESTRTILYFNKRQDSGGMGWQGNACGTIDTTECTVRILGKDEAQDKMGREIVMEVIPNTTLRRFYLAGENHALLGHWAQEIRRIAAVVP